jgi:DNA recombination protein RmuC
VSTSLIIAILAIAVVVLVIGLIIALTRLSKIQSAIDSSVQNSVNNSVSQAIANYIDKITTSFGSIKQDYGQIADKLLLLTEIGNDTKALKSYLTNPKMRGVWGERMVEDIINLVGLKEGINYEKQKVLEAGKPDFTFKLPNGKCINLDAKFSLDNYMKYVEAESDADKENYKKEFLKDVAKTIDDVSKRDYINEKTVDFAVVFIASEAVYSFLLAEKPNIIDEALKKKIVLSCPTNLYAMLSIVRQAAEYFSLEQSSKEVLEFMDKFRKEWNNFTAKFDKIGDSIDKLKDAFNEVSTTRKNKLDSILYEVDRLTKEAELPEEESQSELNSKEN